MLDAVHVGRLSVEPIDIHASIRHLDALFDLLISRTSRFMPIVSVASQSRRARDGSHRARVDARRSTANLRFQR